MTDHEQRLRALAADVLGEGSDEATLTVHLPGGGEARLVVYAAGQEPGSSAKHCAGCQHWNPDPTLGRGVCLRISEPTNPGEVIEDGRPVLRAASAHAYLETPANFGCTAHEPVGRVG